MDSIEQADGAQNSMETSLEEALTRLDGLVKEMEEGGLSLEAMIAKYEEGMGLVKSCEARLESAQKRIEVIARGVAGEDEGIDIEEFEPLESHE